MNRPHRISPLVIGRTVLAVVWVATACAAAARGEPTSLPEPTRRALEENARKLWPLTVNWERTRRSDFPEEEFLTKAHYTLDDRNVLAPLRVRYIAQEGMFYVNFRRMMPHVDIKEDGSFVVSRTKPLEPQEQEMSFDGKALFNGTPVKDGDQFMGIDKIERYAAKNPQARLTQQSYLMEAGFLVPNSPGELRDGAPVRSSVLAMIAEGARVEGVGRDRVDGVDMQTVDLATANRRVRFTLDPQKNFAVRRRVERIPSGALAVSVDGFDFEKLPKSSLWLPRRIEVEWHTLPEAPELLTPRKLLTETYKVTELKDTSALAEQFALRYDRPGTFIADGRIPGAEKHPDQRVVYRQPASPDELNEVIRAATESGYRPKSRAFRMRIFLGLNVALLAAVVIYWVWKRRSARSAS